MIVTSLDQITQQAAVSPGIQKALDFLQRASDEELPDGRVAIEIPNQVTDGRGVSSRFTFRSENETQISVGQLPKGHVEDRPMLGS